MSRKKVEIFCCFKSLLYLCNTEINQQRTGANAGKTFKILRLWKDTITKKAY